MFLDVPVSIGMAGNVESGSHAITGRCSIDHGHTGACFATCYAEYLRGAFAHVVELIAVVVITYYSPSPRKTIRRGTLVDGQLAVSISITITSLDIAPVAAVHFHLVPLGAFGPACAIRSRRYL